MQVFNSESVFLYTMHSATAQSILENKSEKELSLMLQEVVVNRHRNGTLSEDCPCTNGSYNRKTLDSYGGTSLEEILTGLCPSFDFNTSDMGSNMQLGGLGNGYVLLLIDGKKVHGDVGGQNNLGLIDPSRIERIEIVKGASSALYGSDAMAGVVNIITKKHRDDILIKNTTRGGSYGEIRQSNTIQFKFGKWTSSTNFQLKHSDGWQNTMNEDPNRYEYPVTNSINKTVNRYTDWQVPNALTISFPKLSAFMQTVTSIANAYIALAGYPITRLMISYIVMPRCRQAVNSN